MDWEQSSGGLNHIEKVDYSNVLVRRAKCAFTETNGAQWEHFRFLLGDRREGNNV